MKLKGKVILLDAIFLTLFVFVFMFLVTALFPIKLKVFHPIKDAFADFDYTDFYFSKLKKDVAVSNEIVVVNIGHLSRAEIAHQIDVISKGNPKAIGLDAIFYAPKDSVGDAILKQAIQSAPNLVGICKIKNQKVEKGYDDFKTKTQGYANLFGDDKPEKVIRYFSIAQKIENKQIESFSGALAKQAGWKDDAFINKYQDEKLKINYRNPASFLTVSSFDLFNEDFDVSLFKNKVVLLGYAGIPGDSTDMEDQHFTPMNSKIAGKSLPDMKGIYIHASILQSIHDNTFIRNGASWAESLFTAIITFLTSWLIIFFYVHKAKWAHFVTKLVQLFAGVVFLFVSIWIMHVYHIRTNFTLLFVALVLCADLVYFYDPVAKWLHKRNWFHSEIMKH